MVENVVRDYILHRSKCPYVDAPKPKPFCTKSQKKPSFPVVNQFHPSEFSAMTGALICCLPVLPLLPLPLEFRP